MTRLLFRVRPLPYLVAAILFRAWNEEATGFIPNVPVQQRQKLLILGATNPLETWQERHGYGQSPPSTYQFRDSSRFRSREATSRIGQVAGRHVHEVGYNSRHFDQTASEHAINLVSNGLSGIGRWADRQVKAKFMSYTGKDSYKVGDVSEEILRRVSTGEYVLEDKLLLYLELASIGVDKATPVVKLLLQMLNSPSVKEMGGRVSGLLASTLNEFIKEAVRGNNNYELDEYTKSTFLYYIEKDRHYSGDMIESLLPKSETSHLAAAIGSANLNDEDECPRIDPRALAELEAWDRAFLRWSTANSQTRGTTTASHVDAMRQSLLHGLDRTPHQGSQTMKSARDDLTVWMDRVSSRRHQQSYYR